MNLGEGFKHIGPSTIYKIWGGKKMASMKGLRPFSASGEPLGETWEISIHPDGPSVYEGKSLAEIIESDQLPYLVKLIDTNDYLSVQVHPDDDFAKKHENSLGKTECWIVLGASEGSGIYLGMKPGVTKEDFDRALRAGERMDDFLIYREVEVGDFFYVPAGSIHAIGSGVFLAEVQQSSGITYRVWDWNRVDDHGISRELHIDKAMKVIQFGDDFNQDSTFKIKKNVFTSGHHHIVSHPQFELSQVSGETGENQEIEVKALDRAKGLVNLDGKVVVDGQEVQPYSSMVRKSGNNNSIEIKFLEKGSLLLVE